MIFNKDGTPKTRGGTSNGSNWDIDNREVMFHLDFNPILTYTILENYESSSAPDHDEEEE